MRDNIMFIPTIVLLVVEAFAASFLIWEWFKAKNEKGK